MRRRGDDDVEDFLSAVAAGNLGPDAVSAFNEAFASADPGWSDRLLGIVKRLEYHGSLSHRVALLGKLRPS